MQHTYEEYRARRRIIDARYRARHKEELTVYQKAYHKAYHIAHKAKLSAHRKAHDKANPEKAKTRHRTWNVKNKAQKLDWAQRRREERAGRPRPDRCEVCGNSGRIVFDHCHQRSHFRGWLCNRCNWVLGFVKDDPALLLQLAAYLKRAKTFDPPQLAFPGV